MKAIVQHGYGAPQGVLRLAKVAMPAVGAEDVLVSVRAGSANPWDWHFIRGEPVLLRPARLGGIRRPKFPVPGGDLAGTVAQAGSGVTAFRPGDEVYGFGHGAFAEADTKHQYFGSQTRLRGSHGADAAARPPRR